MVNETLFIEGIRIATDTIVITSISEKLIEMLSRQVWKVIPALLSLLVSCKVKLPPLYIILRLVFAFLMLFTLVDILKWLEMMW